MTILQKMVTRRCMKYRQKALIYNLGILAFTDLQPYILFVLGQSYSHKEGIIYSKKSVHITSLVPRY